MRRPGLVGATQRVTLACQALRAAASHLALEAGNDDAVRELEQEVEHVCELAERLERRAADFGSPASARG